MQERKKYPQLIEIAARVPPNKLLNREDFKDALAELDKSLRSVPATAQVQPLQIELRAKPGVLSVNDILHYGRSCGC